MEILEGESFGQYKIRMGKAVAKSLGMDTWVVIDLDEACYEIECDYRGDKFYYSGEGDEFEIDEDYCKENIKLFEDEVWEEGEKETNYYHNYRLARDSYEMILNEINRLKIARQQGIHESVVQGAL